MPNGGRECLEIVPYGSGPSRPREGWRYLFRNWWSGDTLGTWPGSGPPEALEAALLQGSSLMGIDLRGVDLRGCDLTGADLRFANLRGARLRGASLTGARLVGATLAGSDLSEASLSGADLRGASLRGATLRGADFTGADLGAVRLADTEPLEGRWSQYLSEEVPALLTSGGHSLEEVATDEAWESTDWRGSPLQRAFDAETPDALPRGLRRIATMFQRLFQLRLIPQPVDDDRLPSGAPRPPRGIRNASRTAGRRRGTLRGTSAENRRQMEQGR